MQLSVPKALLKHTQLESLREGITNSTKEVEQQYIIAQYAH